MNRCYQLRGSLVEYRMAGDDRVCSMLLLLLLVSLLIASAADKGSQPRIVSAYQKEYWLTAGDTVRLTCPVAADPVPIFTWKKDGEDIHIGWERFRIRGDVLLIKGLDPGDSGIYVCLATNGFGTVTVQYSICVLGNDTDPVTLGGGTKDIACNFNGNGEMPSFVNVNKMKERYLQLIEGETARLNCEASGKPKPEIRWFKDGRELLRNHNNAGNEWLLTLSDVTSEQGGQYMCSAFNRVGSINYTYTLKITGKQQNSPPEFWLSVLKNVTVSVGSVASFHCEVYSDVETRIQWLRQVPSPGDKKNLNYTIVMEDKHFMVVQRGQTQVQSGRRYLSKLAIYPVGLNDSGTYVCSAANSHGFQLQSAYLKVIPDKDNIDAGGNSTDGLSQFLPIVATIASMFFILVLAFIVYVVFRNCLPSDRCSSSSLASNRRSPSAPAAYPIPRTNFECQENSLLPHKYHPQQQQNLCSGHWTQGHPGGPKTADASYLFPTTMTKYSVPAMAQGEQLLYSPHYESHQRQFYEHC